MQIISEIIRPQGKEFIAEYSAVGEPCLPAKFKWRKKVYELESVLGKEKKTSPCHSGAEEQYLRQHIYKIRTTTGEIMKISFDRQPKSYNQRFNRWYLVSIENREQC